jgi:prepilin-type N-terminal cleavage/methylation domain-containing protein
MHIPPATAFSRPGLLQNRQGFTLAEMAIVVLITGLMLGAAASIALPILHKARRIETDQKMQNIARVIDDYAAQNLRVPCPAIPDSKAANPPRGYEAGSGPTGNIVPSDCGTDPAGWEGIVPFRTLNIPVEWIRDSANHYITYAISPAFAQDVMKDSLPVHSRCRTAEWFMAAETYDPTVTDPKTGKPAVNVLIAKSERKARFCCSGALPGTDLVILDASKQPQIAIPRQVLPASYRPANVIFPDPYVPDVQVPADDRATSPVYVLVSHGREGHGAWTGSGKARFSLIGATPAEIENGNGDRVFIEIPPADRTGKEMGFDNIVLWRTQDMVFAEQGKSCSLP